MYTFYLSYIPRIVIGISLILGMQINAMQEQEGMITSLGAKHPFMRTPEIEKHARKVLTQIQKKGEPSFNKSFNALNNALIEQEDYFGLGLLHKLVDNTDQSIEYLKKYGEGNKKDPWFWYYRGLQNMIDHPQKPADIQEADHAFSMVYFNNATIHTNFLAVALKRDNFTSDMYDLAFCNNNFPAYSFARLAKQGNDLEMQKRWLDIAVGQPNSDQPRALQAMIEWCMNAALVLQKSSPIAQVALTSPVQAVITQLSKPQETLKNTQEDNKNAATVTTMNAQQVQQSNNNAIKKEYPSLASANKKTTSPATSIASVSSSSSPVATTSVIIVPKPTNNNVQQAPTAASLVATANPATSSTLPSSASEPVDPVERAYKELAAKSESHFDTCTRKKLEEYEKILNNAQKINIDVSQIRVRIMKALVGCVNKEAGNNANKRQSLLGALIAKDDNVYAKLAVMHYKEDLDKDDEAWPLLSNIVRNPFIDYDPEIAQKNILKYARCKDPKHKAEVMQFVTMLVKDEKRMERIKFSDQQRGTLYTMLGSEAFNNNDLSIAIEFFNKAAACGDITDAYTCGMACIRANNYEAAIKQFALVGEKHTKEMQTYAWWNKAVAEYAMGNAAKLEEICEPFFDKVNGIVVRDDHMFKLLSAQAVATLLEVDAKKGNNNVLYVWGCFLEYSNKLQLAFEAYTNVLAALKDKKDKNKDNQEDDGSDAVLRYYCLEALRRLEQKRYIEAAQYLYDNHPTSAQIKEREQKEKADAALCKEREKVERLRKEADLLYELIRDDESALLSLTPDIIAFIETDAKSNNNNAKIANLTLGLHYITNGTSNIRAALRAELEGKDNTKGGDAAKKAFERARTCLSKVLEQESDDKKRQVLQSRLAMLINNIAGLTDDEDQKIALYKKSAEFGCFSNTYMELFNAYTQKAVTEKNPMRKVDYTTQATLWLQKAYEQGNVNARLLFALRAIEGDKKDLALAHKITSELLEELNADNNALTKEEQSHLYRLKTFLCGDDVKERIIWFSKLAEMGDNKSKHDLAFALIEDGQYKQAQRTLQSIGEDKEVMLKVATNVLAAVVNYRLSPDDSKAHEKFIAAYSCYLNERLAVWQCSMKAPGDSQAQKKLDDYLENTFKSGGQLETAQGQQIQALQLMMQGNDNHTQIYKLAQQSKQYVVESLITFNMIPVVHSNEEKLAFEAANRQIGLEILIKGIASEPCSNCSFWARHILVHLLQQPQKNKQPIHKLNITTEIAHNLEKIYESILKESQPNEADEKLIIFISGCLCDYYDTVCNDINKLQHWLSILQKEYLCSDLPENINFTYYDAVCEMHFKKDNKKALELYEKSAKQGHPGSQRELVKLYALGADGISSNRRRAESWAGVLMNNPNASSEQKAWAQIDVGLCAQGGMLYASAKCIEARKKNNVDGAFAFSTLQQKEYKTALDCYKAAEQLVGIGELLQYYMALYWNAGEDEAAKKLYADNRDSKAMLDCDNVYKVAFFMLKIDKKYTKELFDKMITALTSFKKMPDTRLDVYEKCFTSMADLVVKKSKEAATANVADYGFASTAELDELSSTIIRLITPLEVEVRKARATGQVFCREERTYHNVNAHNVKDVVEDLAKAIVKTINKSVPPEQDAQ